MDKLRWLRHWLHAPASRAFPQETMHDIQQAIADGEAAHDGELCFVVETRLPARYLLGGRSIRARADSVFGDLKVWDTDRRTGVLVYVLVADRALQIVPDSGIVACTPAAAWDAISTQMDEAFHEDRWREGTLAGIAAIHALLARHLPPGPARTHKESPQAQVLA